jgi:hypothetical protein
MSVSVPLLDDPRTLLLEALPFVHTRARDQCHIAIRRVFDAPAEQGSVQIMLNLATFKGPTLLAMVANIVRTESSVLVILTGREVDSGLAGLLHNSGSVTESDADIGVQLGHGTTMSSITLPSEIRSQLGHGTSEISSLTESVMPGIRVQLGHGTSTISSLTSLSDSPSPSLALSRGDQAPPELGNLNSSTSRFADEEPEEPNDHGTSAISSLASLSDSPSLALSRGDQGQELGSLDTTELGSLSLDSSELRSLDSSTCRSADEEPEEPNSRPPGSEERSFEDYNDASKSVASLVSSHAISAFGAFTDTKMWFRSRMLIWLRKCVCSHDTEPRRRPASTTSAR